MSETRILDPEFIDLEKTRVKFKIVNSDGFVTVAELTVPPNRQAGVNAYWDRIVAEFDIEEMRRKRNEQEVRVKRQQEFDKKRREGKEENDRLIALFNKKMKLFNLPVIANASNEIKAAIRRSPDENFLNFIYFESLRKIMVDNNFSYSDLLDYLEQLEEESQQSPNEQPAS